MIVKIVATFNMVMFTYFTIFTNDIQSSILTGIVSIILSQVIYRDQIMEHINKKFENKEG